MKKRSGHADAVERIGFLILHEHFGITRQAYRNWRSDGVPSIHHKTLILLGEKHGIALPEIGA